jgi:hypothetical protein
MEKLNKKLILEELDTPELTEEEKEHFNISLTGELLTQFLPLYALVNQYIESEDVDESIKLILQSINEDLALIIGKLQESVKEALPEEQADLVRQGEEDSQELTI